MSTDCIVGPLPCSGTWMALNKQYSKDFLKRFGSPENSNCSSTPDSVPPPVTECVDKICKATDKIKNASFWEWRQENPL